MLDVTNNIKIVGRPKNCMKKKALKGSNILNTVNMHKYDFIKVNLEKYVR